MGANGGTTRLLHIYLLLPCSEAAAPGVACRRHGGDEGGSTLLDLGVPSALVSSLLLSVDPGTCEALLSARGSRPARAPDQHGH